MTAALQIPQSDSHDSSKSGQHKGEMCRASLASRCLLKLRSKGPPEGYPCHTGTVATTDTQAGQPLETIKGCRNDCVMAVQGLSAARVWGPGLQTLINGFGVVASDTSPAACKQVAKLTALFEEHGAKAAWLDGCVAGFEGDYSRTTISKQLKKMGLRRGKLTDGQVRRVLATVLATLEECTPSP